MTNPKTRKTGGDSTKKKAQQMQQVQQEFEDDQCILENWERMLAAEEEADAAEDERDAESITLTPDLEDEEDDDTDVASCSSFSLQECIDEFRARRSRRISTQSREVPEENNVAATTADPAEVDLINQNRSNKEHERKSKPCKNGFCYCFTSDSGDGAGCGVVKAGTNVRQPRRGRKSETTQVNATLHKQATSNRTNEKRRLSAPATLKVPQSPRKQQQQQQQQLKITRCAHTSEKLTAFSSLKNSSADAPLIHIIQELHNNCVISEVRVNKEKLQAQQEQQHRCCHSSPKKQTKQFRHEKKCTSTPEPKLSPVKPHMATAPTLEKISELDTPYEETSFLAYNLSLNSSARSADSTPRHKHQDAGRLLQKRLSITNIKLKPHNLDEPPAKPPRSSVNFDRKCSNSTTDSTSPSVRDAERVVDEFLRSKGIAVPGEEPKSKHSNAEEYNKGGSARSGQRKSYPLTQSQRKPSSHKLLPSCPSLSDIEHLVDTKKIHHNRYNKNIQRIAEKSVKERSFGWQEPKITEMLNYDAQTTTQKDFTSQTSTAEPQTLGWRLPHKIDLDTVDGTVRHNLASNIETKHTPIKTRLLPGSAKKEKSNTNDQKFIWGEQWRNLSPWTLNKQTSGGKTKTNRLKSNLKSSSCAFLKNSKKKILRLVTPKKDNKYQPRNKADNDVTTQKSTVQRTWVRTWDVGIQTSREDLRSNSITPQSPPGSYHSALLPASSQQSSTPTTQSGGGDGDGFTHFDFTRTVQSPPKKAPRSSQRKLNFPLDCSAVNCSVVSGEDCNTERLTKTYRSFHSDLDQDATLSKMGFILSNIRAKLEASDEHAIRTFQEIERREQQSDGIDCIDSHRSSQKTRVEIHRNIQQNLRHSNDELHEPIYSEIEEDSLHISGSPQFYDNRTGIQRFPADSDPYALYAKVNKVQKLHDAPKATTTKITAVKPKAAAPPTALGQLLHESLKQATKVTLLPPLPETPNSSDVSYTSPPTAVSETEPTYYGATLLHCQSLNNIRVQEQHSPPKRHCNLSKSDLSLHRSNIFMENLCRSEIIVESGQLKRLEKVNNNNNNKQTQKRHMENNAAVTDLTSVSAYAAAPEIDDDYASYELPLVDNIDLNAAGSQMNLAGIAQAHINNQSTPKKEQQSFMTKNFADEQFQLDINISSEIEQLSTQNQSNSCPTTPHKFVTQTNADVATQHSTHAGSLDEVCAKYATQKGNCNNDSSVNKETASSTLARYKRLKNALQKSFRCSKNFLKTETKRLSTSFSFPTPHSSTATGQCSSAQYQNEVNADTLFDLDILVANNATVPVKQQLVNVVSVCRQLPDLEISPEMVEAERLLLLSTVSHGLAKQQQTVAIDNETKQLRTQRFFVDSMRVPVIADASHDIFFNYFYICTFECGGVIRSTQTVECHNQEAIFRDCGIEFSLCATETAATAVSEQNIIRCEIFMLRLRKVSTLTLESHREIKMPQMLTQRRTSTSTSSSGEQIVSRFRLHAAFNLKPCNFVPYEYVPQESKRSDRICLRSTRKCKILLTPRSKRKSTNIGDEVTLSGRAELRLPKCTYSGFLNVQEPHTLHNWNRRWCTLNGLQMQVWCDVNNEKEKPVLSLDLRCSKQTLPITAAEPELCARARSFCVQCAVSKADEHDDEGVTAAIFFNAETQLDFQTWLVHINSALDFVATWLQT